MLLLCLACVECIKNNIVNSSFRSKVALIRRPWMQVLLHVVRDSVLERLRIIKFKSEVKHQPADSQQGVSKKPKTIEITYC